MLTLTNIKSNFTPVMTNSWSVEFSAPELNVIAGKFPAKSVTYDRYKFKSIDIPIAPGVSMGNLIGVDKSLKLSITYYEDTKDSISSWMGEYYRSLEKEGKSDKHDLTVTITEYKRDGSIRSSDQFIVQISTPWTRMLTQEALPSEVPGEFHIIGVNKLT